MYSYNLQAIPDGVAGIRETLKIMALVTKKYKSAPAIRELALRLVANCPEKKWALEAACVLSFVQKKIRYTRDISGVETIQTPIQTLRIGQGDCDDKSILYASLLNAIGHPTRFVAVGSVKGRYSHVLVQTKIAGRWVWAETTENWALGRAPKFKTMMVQN